MNKEERPIPITFTPYNTKPPEITRHSNGQEFLIYTNTIYQIKQTEDEYSPEARQRIFCGYTHDRSEQLKKQVARDFEYAEEVHLLQELRKSKQANT